MTHVTTMDIIAWGRKIFLESDLKVNLQYKYSKTRTIPKAYLNYYSRVMLVVWNAFFLKKFMCSPSMHGVFSTQIRNVHPVRIKTLVTFSVMIAQN